jgi:hypothetical protein
MFLHERGPPAKPIFIYRSTFWGGGVTRPTNRGQLERTLAELQRTGRIEPVDAAVVQGLRSMAGALDADPSNAALWRQYREALRELTADDDGGSASAALAELFAEVGDAPPS